MTKKIILSPNSFVLVDDEDYEYLNQWKWYQRNPATAHTYYAARHLLKGEIGFDSNFRKTVHMYRSIMERFLKKELKTKEYIDHIDGRGWNNQKENLRIVTCRENSQNRHTPSTSKYAGVAYITRDHRWQAKTKVNGIHKNLGYFKDEEDAHKEYKYADKLIKENRMNEFWERYKKKYSSKYKGVTYHHPNKWYAVIGIGNRQHKHLGSFDTEEEAHEEYLRAEELLNDGKIDEFWKRYQRKTSSKYKGVSKNKRTGRWVACPYINGKRIYLGYFDTEEEAHQKILEYMEEYNVSP